MKNSIMAPTNKHIRSVTSPKPGITEFGRPRMNMFSGRVYYITALGLWGVCLLWGALLPGPLSAAEPAGTDIHILVGAPTEAAFRPRLFGANLQWTNGGDGLMPEGGVFDTQATVIKRIKDWLAPTVIRFPGGTLANRYAWADGVSDRSPDASAANLSNPRKRGAGLNFDGQAEPMVFGSAEYLRLLSALGAQGMITANLNAPPEESAAWLKWLADQARRLDPAPRVLWWEIGNESYFKESIPDIKAPANISPEEYVKRFTAIAAALRSAAQEKGQAIQLGAVVEGNLLGVTWRGYAAPDAERWNRTVMQGLADQADFFIVHLYSPYDVKGLSDLNIRQLILASPARLSANLETIAGQMRKKVPIWITEFNLMTDEPEKSWQYGEAPVQGVFIADLLMEYARQDIAGACIWSLVGNHNFGLIRDARETMVRLRPAGALYKNLQPWRGAAVLATEYRQASSAGSGQALFTIRGLEPLRYEKLGVMELEDHDPWLARNPTIAPVNALALEQGGQRYLMLVNRSVQRSATVSVQGAAMVSAQDLLRVASGPPRPLKPGDAVTLPPSSVWLIHYRQ